jgi:hypothetical protein
MAADLQHTLTNLEITPPSGAWNAIAIRLDTEFDAAEIKVAEKIADLELAPPAAAWANIEAGLEEEAATETAAPAKIIRRPFRAWAAAAAAIVVIALGGWYYLNNNTAVESVVTKVPEAKTPSEQKTVPGAAVVEYDSTSSAVAVYERPLPRRSGTLLAGANRVKVSQANFQYEPIDEPGVELPDNLPHSGLQNMRAVNASYSPNVEAPPIRDADGNIILDKDLIFASDNNYIVVTGPNGEQTRISSKFLPLLGSLNGNLETLDYFQFFLNENNIWKLRFNEWRDRMLRQSNFIPTATNLLDIMELKEFLQEN